MAQFGSALDWGSRGRGFKSRRPDAGQRADPESRSALIRVLGTKIGQDRNPRYSLTVCQGGSARLDLVQCRSDIMIESGSMIPDVMVYEALGGAPGSVVLRGDGF